MHSFSAKAQAQEHTCDKTASKAVCNACKPPSQACPIQALLSRLTSTQTSSQGSHLGSGLAAAVDCAAGAGFAGAGLGGGLGEALGGGDLGVALGGGDAFAFGGGLAFLGGGGGGGEGGGGDDWEAHSCVSLSATLPRFAAQLAMHSLQCITAAYTTKASCLAGMRW